MEITELSFADFDNLTNEFTDLQIAEKFGIGKNNAGYYRRKLKVKSFAEKHGITVGVKGVSNVSNRKIFFNERFFQSIDSEVKAYTLGLMITDGHITKEMHRARISLTESDSYILREIAEAMDFEGDLLITKPQKNSYQVHDVVNLNLNSTVLCQDLLNLGLATPKTNIVSLPKIDSELECHLLRGMWDGDGTISKNDTSSTLSGNKELLESVADCLHRNGITTGSVRPNKSIYRLSFHGIKGLDWMYGCNPSIVLQRKLARYTVRKLLASS